MGIQINGQTDNISAVDGSLSIDGITNINQAINISNNGFVGIGTTNPQGRLHLSTPVGSDAVLVLDDVNRNAVVYAAGSTGTQGQFVFRRGLPSSYTDQMIIYNEGNITKPLQSFCDTGSTNSWGAAGSLTVIGASSAKGNWSSTTANVGNNFSTTTDLYTCPRTGVYAISCSCAMDNVPSSPSRTIFVLSINGGYEEITELFDAFEGQSPCVLRKLNTNDTIGLGINGVGGSIYNVRLQVYLLG
jgi:hypothetical protein